MRSLLLTLRTVRHLRPVQWLYLPLRRLQARVGRAPRPPREAWPAPPSALARAVLEMGVDEPEGVVERADRILRREFTFLNHTEHLPQIRWHERYVGHLWSYNLHYFDYARDLAWAFRQTGAERYRDAFLELALAWVRSTAPGRGDGWEPYAVSLRLPNWVQAWLLFGEALPADAREEIGSSLALQAAWLERRLERHIQANHLQKNHHALAVAGIFFGGRDGDRWRERGLRGSWRAVREQVLPDGGHYERSPMYHAIALQDFLQLVALCDALDVEVPADVRVRVGRMAEALGVLSRADGRLHLLQDAAHGIAPSKEYLDRLARRALGRGIAEPEGLLSLPASGYYGFHDAAEGHRLLVDCGEPGPRYQPGHAHCGLLGFELDLAGRPFAVDAGVHGYDGDPFREYVRSTRAHNTVMIGGREQHEVWGTFRVARRARVVGARQEGHPAHYRFVGVYRPYHSPEVTHHRTIERRGSQLRVTDRVSGAPGERLTSFLHLHPSLRLRPTRRGYRVGLGEGEWEVVAFGADGERVVRGETHPRQGWHCPEFGRACAADVLELTVESNAGGGFGYVIRPVASGD